MSGRRRFWPLLLQVSLLASSLATPGAAADAIPIPPIRPSEPDEAVPAPMLEERPTFDAAAAARCEAELRRRAVRFTPRKALDEQGCGAERPLELSALPEGVDLVGPAVVLRCAPALALVRWLEEVVQPSARLHLGTAVESIAVSTSYQCRDRAGSKTPSQHAFANALDVMGLRSVDGSDMRISARPDSAEPVRAFQAAIRGGACAYFTTVLGPTVDEDHGDHLHLDLKQRPGGYRICE